MVSIRPARPSDSRAIASIHVDTWRRTYAGIVRRDTLSGLSKSERAGYWRAVLSRPGRRGFLLVAEVGRRLVGFVSGGPGREDDAQYKGEIYAIYVLPRMQFRGVGRALFLAGVDCLLLAGIRSLLVWTLAANPYRRFYESLGGEPVRKRTITLGGQRLREVGYGWADIKPLAPPFVLPLP
jgi:GNAT superfamily N-acetyltransferase